MTLLDQSYHKEVDEKAPYDPALQYIPLRDLEADTEHLKKMALEFRGDLRAGGNRAVLELWIARNEAELRRRYRLYELQADDPQMPKFQSRAVDTDVRVLTVKTAWPILTFCQEVLGTVVQRSTRYGWVARCPLPGHDDRSPSFVIYESTDSAWCFGCDRGGDILDLAKHFFGYERFFDKLECIERLTGIDHAEIVRSIHTRVVPKAPKAAPASIRFVPGGWIE